MKLLKLCMAAGVGLILSFASGAMANEGDVTESEALLITSGEPDDPKFANAGENLRNGVGSMFIQFASTAPFGFLCSMSVIDDWHVLTAAHCLRNTAPDGSPDPVTLVAIVLPSGADIITLASGFAVNPLFDDFAPRFGAFAPGDIAVVELQSPLPDEIDRYDLYRTPDEFGRVTRHYGHGRSGTGDTGATGGSNFFYARTGVNTYDQTLEPFFGPLFDQLLHDYDNHREKNNAMSWWFGGFFCNSPAAAREMCATAQSPFISDHKDYGGLEVGIAPGDSGGPGFIDGKIAGVHSFGFTHFCDGTLANKPDFTCGLDSSWGEMAGDTRVSTYASWIDGVVGGSIDTTPIPEPAPAASADSRASTSEFELSEQMQYLIDAAMVRTLRRSISIEEFKAQHGIE